MTAIEAVAYETRIPTTDNKRTHMAEATVLRVRPNSFKSACCGIGRDGTTASMMDAIAR